MNGLTVLHPLFLSLLPVAALPVLFHLLFRLRKKPKTYPSLMFFRRIDPRLNARRRLREWIVLLLRVLLIAFLLLALAHPRLLGKGREGTLALVLLIDNSGSMSGHGDGGQTKLRQALAGAHALASRLHAKDSAGVVLLVEDPAVLLPAGLTSDQAALSRTLDSIGQTEASGMPARALERAMALLQSSSATQHEIHILSDLQETEWNHPSLNLRAPTQRTSIRIHRITTPLASKANVALVALKLPEKKIPAGRRVPVQVQLANPSSREATVQLNWADDAGHRNQQEVAVAARGEKTLALSLDPPEPGLRWANVWVEGDSFEADNRASLAFRCDEKRPVLFLGKSADFGLLPMALSPSKDGRLSGLVPVFADWQSLNETLEQRNPVCAVTTAEALLDASSDLSL
jgi:Aerotolerance regulator N-terminal/von Willebrand factor type A domain